MPAHSVGDQRWTQTGVNEAGDPVYERSTGPVSSYDELTKAQLADILEGRGLPKSGTKDELVARLHESDAGS